jgi:hypothetical protein
MQNNKSAVIFTFSFFEDFRREKGLDFYEFAHCNRRPSFFTFPADFCCSEDGKFILCYRNILHIPRAFFTYSQDGKVFAVSGERPSPLLEQQQQSTLDHQRNQCRFPAMGRLCNKPLHKHPTISTVGTISIAAGCFDS